MKNWRIIQRIVLIIIGFSITACASSQDDTAVELKPFEAISAAQLVSNITIGWSLGNTLDSTDYGDGWLKDASISQLETCWGNPVTTKANIDAIKNAGFNAVRIPVSWAKAVDSKYNIRDKWMKRIVEVVNYAVKNDMYIILNTHHDEHVFKFTNSRKEESLKAFKRIWEQIADTFKNYDEKLIFEGLNEPRTVGAPYEWSGGNAEERGNLNEYYKVFVDTVRGSGGNNDKRILMINTYAASSAQSAMDGLIIPAEAPANKIIVSIHCYDPFSFTYPPESANKTWSKNNPSDTGSINSAIDRAYNTFVTKGLPVIIGEFAATNKNNEDARAEYAEYFVSYALAKGIKCFWWDTGNSGGSDGFPNGGSGILNRKDNTFKFPKIKDALMRGSDSS